MDRGILGPLIEEQREVPFNSRITRNRLDLTNRHAAEQQLDLDLRQVDSLPELERVGVGGMQLPKHGQVTDAGKSPRMVVLRSVVDGQPDRTVETLQQFFDVALEVEEIEFPGGFMD